jgi:hypothetical protein
MISTACGMGSGADNLVERQTMNPVDSIGAGVHTFPFFHLCEALHWQQSQLVRNKEEELIKVCLSSTRDCNQYRCQAFKCLTVNVREA